MTRVERLRRLEQAYGREIDLIDDGGEAETYRLLAEYRLDGRVYAALQTPEMRRDDEIAFFRVIDSDEGGFELENLADEDEWERAAEGYDELVFEESAEDRGIPE